MSVQQPVPLDYLVILDLEATCDDPTDPHRPEIVEFPWLVYDLATQTVLDHKQIFITPRWNANPNPPPDAVRGLGADVAFAPSLADALFQFDAYVYQSFVVTGKSFYLVTDGHWDLTYYLFSEAARKAVALAPHFRTYINLRTEFSRCYPHAPVPTDRRTMFSFLDISTRLRLSGLEECMALAAVVTRLLKDGHRFTQPEMISDHDWATMPAVATPVAAAVPVGGIVRLRGLPWACTESEVEQFLSGIPIVPSGVHFVRNSQGKPTGEAFVQLETPDAVTLALARDKQSMGKRYIEVFKSSPMDMANHLGRAEARRHMHPSGHAHSNTRAKGPHQPYNGARSTRQQPRSQKDISAQPQLRSPQSALSPTGLSYVVRVTGLPKNAVADDLLAVFNGLEMLGEGIHLVMEDTDCTGEAYVELVSEAWAKKAVSRSGALITCAMGVAGTVHPVPVEIRRSSAAQLKAAFLMDGESDDRSSGKRSGGSQKSAGADAQFFIRVRGIDERIQTEEIQNLFEGFNIRDDDVKFLPQLAGNGASSASEHRPTAERVARVAFQTKESRDAALANKQLALSGASITVEDGGSEKRARSSSSGKAAGLMPDATASNVVRMRGLPYASDDNDIAQFFKGYPIAPGGISRGKDRHGRASGEAWVTFVNLEDAEEVVAKLDKAHMGNRYIELKF